MAIHYIAICSCFDLFLSCNLIVFYVLWSHYQNVTYLGNVYQGRT
jgi:hypothetical protein